MDDAMAHVQDLIGSADGETKEKTEEILGYLEKGDLRKAGHELKTMLAEVEGPEQTAVQLHIVLTLNALQNQADDDAIGHLEDTINAATKEEGTRSEQFLADLKVGEGHDIEHDLEALLG